MREAHPDLLAYRDPTCDGPAVACPQCQPQMSDERPRMPRGGDRRLADEPELIAAADARVETPELSGLNRRTYAARRRCPTRSA
jgi:hypothetical protein